MLPTSDNDNYELIKKAEAFLDRSAREYSKEALQQENDLTFMEDSFDEDVTKSIKRKNRMNFSANKIGIVVDAICAPYANSPYHARVNDGRVQEAINDVENLLENKVVGRQAFKRGVSCGAGYVIIGIDDADKPFLEFAENQSSVAVDPYAVKPSLEDASEGAVVDYISHTEARRMFPDVNLSYNSGINFNQLARWTNESDSIQLVNYYYKDDNGSVHLAKICGDCVQDIDLRITVIPIIRFAGYSKYRRRHRPQHIGMVTKLRDLQVFSNITLSSYAERANASNKATFSIGLKAIGGGSNQLIMNQLQKYNDGKTTALFYDDTNGGVAPIFNPTAYTHEDLDATTNMLRQQMEDVGGINLAGVQPTEKTATEANLAQINQINNHSELYLNAEFAQRTIAKILIQIVNGNDMPFVLEGGIGEYLDDAENKKLVSEVATLLQGNHAVLAYLNAMNSKAKCRDAVMMSIKANNPTVVFPTDNFDIFNAYAKLKATADNAVATAEQINKQRLDAEKQVQELNLQLMDTKASMAQRAEEFRVNTQIRLMELQQKQGLDTAKLNAEVQKETNKAVNDAQKVEIERQKVALDAEKVATEVASEQPVMVEEEEVMV